MKNYVGKYVYFSKEYGKYYYVWIKKINKIEKLDYYIPFEDRLNNSIRGVCVYGTHSLVMWKNGNKLLNPTPFRGNENLSKESFSNAQDAARLPTEEEMNLYRKFWRQYRIFGLTPKENY